MAPRLSTTGGRAVFGGAMQIVSPAIVVAGMLLTGPVDLDPEDGGNAPQIGWYEAACRSWREHLASRISALRRHGALDDADAAQFRAAVARAESGCIGEQWQGLRLFASLDRALGDWGDRRPAGLTGSIRRGSAGHGR